MFERFTERARQVVVLAQEESRVLRRNYIGAEHILLGLLREQEGLAARVLESFDITVDRARAREIRIVGSGEDEVTSGQIPFTPRAKKGLEVALREMIALGHNYIGTEHVLLGLVRDRDGVAARILLDFDADPEKVRNEVIRQLPLPAGRVEVDMRAPLEEPSREEGITAWLGDLRPMLVDLLLVETELGRSPDAGDLLLALASIPSGVVERALSELGVAPAQLPGAVEHARAGADPVVEPELEREREDVRRRHAEALQAGDPNRAESCREKEHQLTNQINDRILERRRRFREELGRSLRLD